MNAPPLVRHTEYPARVLRRAGSSGVERVSHRSCVCKFPVPLHRRSICRELTTPCPCPTRSPLPRAHPTGQRYTGPSSKSPRAPSSRPQATPHPSTLSAVVARRPSPGEAPRGNLPRADGSRSRILLKMGSDVPNRRLPTSIDILSPRLLVTGSKSRAELLVAGRISPLILTS